ncbi:hypothetical protein AMES_2757 [Amycolatopsis mediterranei S699]|uniref:Uncharacterized protein n=3 Tax=Amycolatopsis mediterranei TaxID=33910 RepID=A0A0H3D1Q6_AMYMU|nr:conserved hypothetical protein [Amycolatopsis mediterranei U32]AEK41319.1 hypothetical protein RAM_14155 [Amycolatopsis mediterranei S699]AFO76293.1 hypothetical protein AMES_2757 [Amycolatopsis mediterranei S699]AGT83422.1 hypothetical protein B737_2758 [Amycolatopsis mediterranei RB]
MLTGMRTVVHGDVHVHYGQIYVHDDEAEPFEGDLAACFAGQRNGLCGAADPGHLFLITGLHTGNVGFTAEVHESEPPDSGAEDVVEASFHAEGRTVLVTWGGSAWWDLELTPGDYRVRYSGTAIDAGRERDTRLDGEPRLDSYLLQFWPAPPAPDVIVRETSAIAAYWHGFARDLPPPPTDEELAARWEARCRAEEEARAKARHEQLLREWGGVLPASPVLDLPPGSLREFAKLDRDLVGAAVAAGPELCRALARRVAHLAFERARLDGVGWIAEGLRALDKGIPLPPPFDDWTTAWDRLLADPDVPHTLVRTPDGRHDNALQQAMAFPAIFAAVREDELEALGQALSAAGHTYGDDRPRFLAEVRAALAELTGSD